MKSTGIVRKIDELGRIVIPREIRKQFELSQKDPLEIYVDGSSIVIKKHSRSCVFCNSSRNVVKFNDKLICESCFEKIVKLYKED